MRPSDWNIVVIGEWNRAILTPAWIGRTMFGLPDGSPVDVLVSIDAPGPVQVRHEGLVVVPAQGRLTIQLPQATVDHLQRALDSMRRAVDDLPRTPLRAIGINLVFGSDDPPASLVANSRCNVESLLSNEGYQIIARRRAEGVEFCGGMLNIITELATNGRCAIQLNFDLQTNDTTRIREWLASPATEYVKKAESLVKLISGEDVT